MNKVKNNINLKTIILNPTLFGLFSLFTSYIFSLLLVKVIFSIPHYETTKSGTLAILISMFLGFPFGVLFYLTTIKLKSIKKKLLLLTSFLFIVSIFLNIYDLIDSSCITLNAKIKWDEKVLQEDKVKLKNWSKICR